MAAQKTIAAIMSTRLSFRLARLFRSQMTEAKEKTKVPNKTQATRARTTRHPGATRQMQESPTHQLHVLRSPPKPKTFISR